MFSSGVLAGDSKTKMLDSTVLVNYLGTYGLDANVVVALCSTVTAVTAAKCAYIIVTMYCSTCTGCLLYASTLLDWEINTKSAIFLFALVMVTYSSVSSWWAEGESGSERGSSIYSSSSLL